MAQGTRRRWWPTTVAALGVVVCTGLAGCLNTDKTKDTKKTQQPTPGLYGTPLLPPGGAALKGSPPSPYGTTGILPAGGTGNTGQFRSTGGAQPSPNGYTGSPNYQPTGSYTPAGGYQPGGMQPLAPSVGPSNYPTGSTYPTGQNPTSSASSFAISAPPAPTLTDVGPLPPAPPPGAGSHYSPVDVVPPTPAVPVGAVGFSPPPGGKTP